MRGGSRNGSSNCADMPLGKLQSDILLLLAAHRDPESYVAGSTYLTRGGSRFSDDIDIFHDREERVARAGEEDAAVLQIAGLNVEWRRREPTFYQAIVSRMAESTKLEWVTAIPDFSRPNAMTSSATFFIRSISRRTRRWPRPAGGNRVISSTWS
jgi:hypothetical protein